MTFSQLIELNLIPGGIVPIAHISKGDVGGREIGCEMLHNQIDASIPSGVTATVDGVRPDGVTFSENATISTTAAGTVVFFDVTANMSRVPGRCVCQITLHDGDEIVGSGNFILMVEDSPLPDASE